MFVKNYLFDSLFSNESCVFYHLNPSSLKKGVNALLVFTFWSHFYFDPYIFILPLLVPKSINA